MLAYAGALGIHRPMSGSSKYADGTTVEEVVVVVVVLVSHPTIHWATFVHPLLMYRKFGRSMQSVCVQAELERKEREQKTDYEKKVALAQAVAVEDCGPNPLDMPGADGTLCRIPKPDQKVRKQPVK